MNISPPQGSPTSFRSGAANRGHHRRGSSQSSNVSHLSTASAPTNTMHQLMESIALAPKGSKMAEDAKKAMALAERAKAAIAGHRHAPKPPAISPPIDVPILSPTPSRPASRAAHRRPSDASSSIGATMLATPAIGEETQATEDPFDFDNYDLGEGPSVTERVLDFNELLNAPYAHPDFSQAPSMPPPSIPLPALPMPTIGPRHPALRMGSINPMVSGLGIDRDRTPIPAPEVPPITSDMLRTRSQHLRPRNNVFAEVPASQNAIGIFWRGDTPQQFSLITEAVGLQETDDVFPIHIAAKNTQVVEIPRQWSGFVQKLSGAPGDPATRCEISFDGQAGLTFFGVNYAYGNNGGAIIRSSPSGLQVGSQLRALQVAPQHLIVNDAGNNRVVLGTAVARPHVRRDIHKFYRDFFENPDQGGIIAGDPSHIVTTRDRHLLIDFA